jgi:hypothetical protein
MYQVYMRLNRVNPASTDDLGTHLITRLDEEEEGQWMNDVDEGVVPSQMAEPTSPAQGGDVVYATSGDRLALPAPPPPYPSIEESVGDVNHPDFSNGRREEGRRAHTKFTIHVLACVKAVVGTSLPDDALNRKVVYFAAIRILGSKKVRQSHQSRCADMVVTLYYIPSKMDIERRQLETSLPVISRIMEFNKDWIHRFWFPLGRQGRRND